jgi:hypothetical protein
MLELRPLLLVVVLACGGPAPRQPEPRAESEAPAATTTRATSDAGSTGACLVVAPDGSGSPATVEGALVTARSLRLSAPRCVVGLERGSIVTEVAVATAGPDLRPLIGARVRITGTVLGGENDLGGSALVILATDVARLDPKAEMP